MVNPAMFCGLRSYKEVEINESQHFPGGAEENNRNLREKILVMERDLNPKLLAHETRLLAARM
jgi:hypothetical protein